MDRPSSSLESRRAERSRAESRRAEKSSMKTRIWTGVIGLPLLIFILYTGGFIQVIGVSFLAFVGDHGIYPGPFNKMIRPKINAVLMLILAIMLMVTIKLDYYFLMPVLLVAFIIVFCYEILSGNVGIERGSCYPDGLDLCANYVWSPVPF